MRVLHVSTYDAHGGAARAASRLFRGLKCEGESVSLVVKYVSGGNSYVQKARLKERSFLRKCLYKATHLVWPDQALPEGFSLPPDDFVSADLADAVSSFRPDIVHLHWIGNNFLSLSDIERLSGFPIVWTLHDSWVFTGGCHVPGECRRYCDSCGCCPFLGGTSELDLSRTLYKQKQRAFAALNLTFVAPSRWMAENARASSLLKGRRIEVIPNGLNVNRYLPVDTDVARNILGLPVNRKIILFGGMSPTTDPNKGFSLLVEALAGMTGDLAEKEDVVLVLFGEEEGMTYPSLPITVKSLGFLRDDATLALAYSAADVMVAPSRQEAFCQTAAEAMACGTPVVAFRTSGLLDVIDHGVNGYLAEPFDACDLRRGIIWAIDSSNKIDLARESRSKAVNEFSIDLIAGRYKTIYESLK